MRGFTEYSDLVAALLVAEQNNELLIKNHQSRPTGTVAYPEINATTFNRGRGGYNRSRGRGGHARFDSHGRGRGNGRNHFRGRGRGRGYVNNYRPLKYDQNNKNHQGKGKYIQEGPSRNHDNLCFRCGKNGHWAKTCKTPEHLCKRYRASVEGKEKEVNFNEIEPKNDTTDDKNFYGIFSISISSKMTKTGPNTKENLQKQEKASRQGP
ncbi:hypothetical protein QL285_063285 [Trifolium repens]|nr:hypothetical protein QL285_063186 [Trifolium repens]KAK2389660.1 hypothetical protein QL285_063236 [Trifolium repens]KAK2389712.1 hypothetical protein QL285_063285 [Trifolium repens]